MRQRPTQVIQNLGCRNSSRIPDGPARKQAERIAALPATWPGANRCGCALPGSFGASQHEPTGIAAHLEDDLNSERPNLPLKSCEAEYSCLSVICCSIRAGS